MDESVRNRMLAKLCAVCMKQSDGAVEVGAEDRKIVFCGTHFDAWLASPERKRALDNGPTATPQFVTAVMDFVNRVRGEELHGSKTSVVPAEPLRVEAEVSIRVERARERHQKEMAKPAALRDSKTLIECQRIMQEAGVA